MESARIQLLPQSTINRIAAGEVVERPLSVVRELVDNALDAGASSILIEVLDGGRTSLRVLDDGTGISEVDLPLALERHATSKITHENDLQAVQSYGFRGEALAAIASVSRMTVRTRTEEQDSGIELEVEGGEIRSSRRISFQIGTEMVVRDLFFNTPARRKFLKSERGEILKISQWVKATSLLHPSVKFRLVIDGREKLQFARRESPLHRAQELYPKDGAMVDYQEGEFSVQGYLSPPAEAKVQIEALSLFVNRRLISDRALVRAVREGFGGLIKPAQVPLGFLHLKMPPMLVDINVHPQKLEVRFADSSRVFTTLLRAVRASLSNTGTLNNPNFSRVGEGIHSSVTTEHGYRLFRASRQSEEYTKRGSPSEPGRFGGALELRPYNSSGSTSLNSDAIPTAFTANAAEAVQEAPEPEGSTSSRIIRPPAYFRYEELRYLGCVLGCYLVCEHDEMLVVVDMHAAHERVQYNRILRSLRAQTPISERLLLPYCVTVSEEVAVRVQDNREHFNAFGFQMEVVSDTIVEIHAKPTLIPLSAVRTLLLELVEEDLSVDRARDATEEQIAARLACHASIRSGDIPGREEVYALFADLDQNEMNNACPHGRPIRIPFSRSKLEALFGRTV